MMGLLHLFNFMNNIIIEIIVTFICYDCITVLISLLYYFNYIKENVLCLFNFDFVNKCRNKSALKKIKKIKIKK